MSEIPTRTNEPATPEAPASDAEERPRTQQFRKRFSGPRLSAEAAERQGRVTQLAWKLLGGREGAMAFLNAHDEALGGRPLDLAVASEEACSAVERAITRLAETPAG